MWFSWKYVITGIIIITTGNIMYALYGIGRDADVLIYLTNMLQNDLVRKFMKNPFNTGARNVSMWDWLLFHDNSLACHQTGAGAKVALTLRYAYLLPSTQHTSI